MSTPARDIEQRQGRQQHTETWFGLNMETFKLYEFTWLSIAFISTIAALLLAPYMRKAQRLTYLYICVQIFVVSNMLHHRCTTLQLRPVLAKFANIFWIMVIKDCLIFSFLTYHYQPPHSFHAFISVGILITLIADCQIGILKWCSTRNHEPRALEFNFGRYWIAIVFCVSPWNLGDHTPNNFLLWEAVVPVLLMFGLTYASMYFQILIIGTPRLSTSIAAHQATMNRESLAFGHEGTRTNQSNSASDDHTAITRSTSANNIRSISGISMSNMEYIFLMTTLISCFFVSWLLTMHNINDYEVVKMNLAVALLIVSLVEQGLNIHLSVGFHFLPQLYTVVLRITVFALCKFVTRLNRRRSLGRLDVLIAFAWAAGQDSLFNQRIRGTQPNRLGFRTLFVELGFAAHLALSLGVLKP